MIEKKTKKTLCPDMDQRCVVFQTVSVWIIYHGYHDKGDPHYLQWEHLNCDYSVNGLLIPLFCEEPHSTIVNDRDIA